MDAVKTLKDVEVENKRVLIRVDFNVPLDAHLNITDDTRIKEALSTINYCIDHKAKSIVLVTHLGRPKGDETYNFIEKFSLSHIIKRVSRLLDHHIELVTLEDKETILNTQKGEIFLLENIRFYKGETKNDEALSKELASLCDIYVNDAFGTSHRAHSSTEGITQFVATKVAGFLLKKEIDAFDAALDDPTRPVCLVIGGAKVSSKITLLNNIIDKVDKIIIGGAMSDTFLKSLGYNVQESLVEDEYLNTAAEILENAKKAGVKVYLPIDVMSVDDIDNPTKIRVVPVDDIDEGMKIVDIGEASIVLFKEVIRRSKTIVWNGPMGIFEMDNYSKGTFELAKYISESYAYSIVGGGDTANAVLKAGVKDKISFVSTGGGASLELLEGKLLPGFKNLDR
jgi:phosphoglycerate kinase